MSLLAVVFDFDGVLADSEPLHYEVFRMVLARHGVDLDRDEYYARYLGYDDAGAFRAVFEDRGREMSGPEIERLVQEKLELFPSVLDGRQVLFPGAESCVHRLADYVPVAIASGALSHDIELILGGTGLRSRFTAIVAADHTARSKPDPEPYARAVALLQERGAVPAGDGVHRRIVAIEDSHWGLQSARGAGLACVGITTSYSAGELGLADLIVRSLDEVTPERLEALVGRS